LFPPAIAEEGDPTGLQVGPLDEACRTVLVVLDLENRHLECLSGVDLVVTHHPLFPAPITRVHPRRPLGQKLAALLAEGSACYAVHTPYDSAQGGLGELLAKAIALQMARPLWNKGRLLKLVTFVPEEHVEHVADALFAAGAGHLGQYSRCSFRTKGTGTFLPQEGASPFKGQIGQEERGEEVRLETVVPAELRRSVERSLLDAHPYEEVAYDLYPLELGGERHGPGRIGYLPTAQPAREVVSRMCCFLGIDAPQAMYGEKDRRVSRVAVCGGSGKGVWRAALDAGAELLLTGEMGYHAGCEAGESGLTVACFGHRESEMPFVDHVGSLLRKQFGGLRVITG